MRIPAVFLVSSMLLAVACGNGGTGAGTAPPNSSGCPTDPDKVAGQPCGSLNVCAYPACEGSKCPATTKVAYCSGAAGAKWEVTTPGDAGGFTDAGIEPDTASADAGDAEADAGDAGADAGDAAASDAEASISDATDAELDAAETSDASTDSPSDTTSDAPDSD